MSESIKHECGIALVRLLKPLDFYQKKYGTWMYGLHKLYLLMEKQHNRGQDGAGVVNLKLETEPGTRYIFRSRTNESEPIKTVFEKIKSYFAKCSAEQLKNVEWVQRNLPFAGEIFLGHLRYGTFGKYSVENVHPVMRQNNWKSKNLVLAGNFNLTNVDELFNKLVYLGQHPKNYSDTVTILENIGHFLDEENERIYRKYKNEGFSKHDITPLIHKDLDIISVLKESSKKWDGGYVIAGIVGNGDSFVIRDPWGIRPCFYYKNDEIVVLASERPAIQTTLNVPFEKIIPLKYGNGLIIRRNGECLESEIRKAQEPSPCSFERIYFSRGTDADIYKERKKLGELLTPQIIWAIKKDFVNTVFSYVPNTAESAFLGLIQTLESYLTRVKKRKILRTKNKLSPSQIEKIIELRPRVEKIAVKDVKLRTFITAEKDRNDLVAHVYDITYGTVQKTDSLVILDDSIVRGTTLSESILRMLDRLNPKKIIVVSSAPQIRFPDCYGIDMAKLGDLIAFRAAIELLKDLRQTNLIEKVYRKAKEQENLPKEEILNVVKEIYRSFTDEQISQKIVELLKPKDLKAELEIIFQTVDNLRRACLEHNGDWYFTGDYPTPGGNKVANTAFIDYFEGRDKRAY